MDSALTELSRQLLQRADPALLESALEALAARTADELVRDVLRALHEAGYGDTLREVLHDDQLARFASESCTTREEDALTAQLRKWLGTGGRSSDDPTRLAEVPPAPTDTPGLLAWADAHGVTRLLMGPAAPFLPALSLPPQVSLFELCSEADVPGDKSPSLLVAARRADEARAFLHDRAAELVAVVARETLHKRALPEGNLGLLARRLRALFHDSAQAELHSVHFVAARPVQVDVGQGRAQGTLELGHGADNARVELQLAGYEQRALEARCSVCVQPRCLHVRVLAARLFDACLVTDDRLHAPLVSFVRVPSWQRFLDALSARPEAPAARTSAVSLTFVLRLEGARPSIAVQQQRVLADGKRSAGKLASPHKLSRLPSLGDRDHALLSAIAAQTRTIAPQFVPLDVPILRALVEHPFVMVENDDAPCKVQEEALHIALVEQPEGLSLQVTVTGADVREAQRARAFVLHRDVARRTLTFATLTPALTRMLDALDQFRGPLPPESYPQIASWAASLRKVARVSTPKALEGLERSPPRKLLLRITPLLDEGVDVSLTVRALPLSPLYAPGRGPELVHGLIDGKRCSVRRELAFERELGEQLLDRLELRDQLELAPWVHRIDSTQGALELLSRAARLGEELELEWAERARPLRISSTIKTADLKVGLFKRGDFCGLTGGVQNAELRMAVDRLLEAARTGERFVPVEGGHYVEIERELFERLQQAQLVMPPLASDAQLPAAAILAWTDVFGDSTTAGDDETAGWLARARSERAPEPTAELSVTLRDYQKRGVAWLLARSTWAPGVCLADEMGLGKTVQTIALLAERVARGPALVVAPTSVVDAWLDELARFAPQLSGICYRGADRVEKLAQLAAGSVLVCSYELLLRDLSHFSTLRLATLVIDEAQVIKNARTLRARAVASLSAEFRVALSGTPVENRLGDLWSLFHQLAPGLLGSWARFRARFAVPIERYDNQERAAVLRGLTRPFLLRRTKREVASELPPRTEVLHLVELSPAEQDLYAAALAHARSALGKRKRNDSGRTVQILAELTRLRQLACHPRLVLDDSRVSSSKLACLVQLLEDLLPRGHRVLIFSQFVRHLELVREALVALDASYLTLDGSTPASERAARVAAFQRGDAQVFLISLKAGGTGLTLTAADYVVHMDPWWNPTAEDQASDRAHRIGQQRPVTVIKLVSQGTIEERVLGLHEHKRRLASLILDDAEAASEPALDLDTLERLIAE